MPASKKLVAHLRRISVKGGSLGGSTRMARLSPAERQLVAIHATMGKLGDRATLWIAQCRYRGAEDYVVMGCAIDAERQFRQARKMFPSGVVVYALRVGEIRPSTYVDMVRTMRELTRPASWRTRALVQVGCGDWRVPQLTKKLPVSTMRAWLEPKKPGRPRKTT